MLNMQNPGKQQSSENVHYLQPIVTVDFPILVKKAIQVNWTNMKTV